MKKILLILPLFVAFFVFSALGVLAQENYQEDTQDSTLRILNQIKERSKNKANVVNNEDEDVEGDEDESMDNDENEKPEKPLTAEERAQKIKELKAMAKEKKCEVLGERIDAKILRYDAGYTKYIQSFENLYERVDTLLLSLNEQGYETDTVQANNEQLRVFIDEIIAMHEVFVEKMEESREPSCLNNAKQFQNIVKEAKVLLTETRTMAKEMHTFAREELRPSLQQLRIQISGEEEVVDDTDDVEDSEEEDEDEEDDSAVEGVDDSYYRDSEY